VELKSRDIVQFGVNVNVDKKGSDRGGGGGGGGGGLGMCTAPDEKFSLVLDRVFIYGI